MRGGYLVLDLKNIEFETNMSIQVDGCYEAVSRANGKPVLLENFFLDGHEIGSTFVSFGKTTTENYDGQAYFNGTPYKVQIINTGKGLVRFQVNE